MEYKFVVGADYDQWRLDKFLSAQVKEISRSEIQANISGERTKVNGKTVLKKGYILRSGDAVEISLVQKPAISGAAEDISLDIRYEDKWLLIVNKPVGMVVHPAPGHYSGTLVNALLGYCSRLSNVGGSFRPGIVHRLDKETSGLLVVAKTNVTHLKLATLLGAREIKRTYLALVCGRVSPDQGRITGPIGRHPRQRTKMAIVENGKPALTDFKVLRHYPRHTLVQVNLHTGRTHQIRVHFSEMGRPVVGDTVYGRKTPDIKYSGHMLHARTLKFVHPFTGKELSVTAQPPPEFVGILRFLSGREAQ